MIPDQTYAETVPPPEGVPVSYSPCEQCGAALDDQQRYCLNCGTRRKHASDPAARFLAAASRRQKPPAIAPPAGRGGSISVFTLGAILLIPLALGVGVLVGHSSSPAPDAKLLSALSRGSTGSGSGTGGAVTGASSATASTGTASAGTPQLVSGTWTRTSGYAVELSSLPRGTTPASAARIEAADRSKGAKTVRILPTSGYKITPAPGGSYVIYSGSYATSAAAGRALSALKGKFPSAHVIHVVIPASAAVSNTKVVSHTQYGSAHQVVGYKPSSTALAKGAQVAKQDAKSIGKQASGAGLPDVVSVP